MRALDRFAMCLAGMLIAGCFLAATGGLAPGLKMLHRWYEGVLITFLFLFLPSMFIALRGRVGRSALVIPICALLAYPVAGMACIFYFLLFEHQLFFSSVKHAPLGLAVIPFVFIPTVTGTWLFGALAGLSFYLFAKLRRAVQPADGDEIHA